MKLLIQSLSLVLCAASLMAADPKKIVIVAGTPSHGPLDHEFNAGALLLKKCLDAVPDVQVVVHQNGWPSDAKVFDGAAAILLYMDGGGGHPVLKDDRIEVIDRLLKRGVGLGCAHYAVEITKEKGGPKFQEWIGGYYEHSFSVNPMWTPEFKTFPDHPITRGVQPFSVNDEWYFNMRFREGMKGVTPILVAKPSDDVRDGPYVHPQGPYPHIIADKNRDEVMMWAMEREDGGRGFGFTGGHRHLNWGNENYRKTVLNALLWLAKAEVPKNGVQSQVTQEDLMKNLDPKPGKKPAVKPTAGSVDTSKAKFKSAVLSDNKTAAIDVDLTGAKNLYLVVNDGGDNFGCDWADWVEPQLIKADGSVVKLSGLKWKSATSGHGEVRVNKNADGGEMRVAGKAVTDGIGTHAPSVIHYELPADVVRFKASGALDEGGTKQGCGSTVQFMVFTEAPAPGLMAAVNPRPASSSAPGAERGSGPAAAEADLKKFEVADGLEISVFASEPMIKNPTNMDIDERGRVWATEGVNYRSSFQKWGVLRPEGDRVVILEDTDGDGKADKEKTFYQGKDINAALGICTFDSPEGRRVIVSCSPNIFMFLDRDRDDKPDEKKVIFSGISGVDHDHGAHAFVFGPDGKLYFNIGNDGRQLKTADGSKFVVDKAGNEVNGSGKPYRQGLVFRCNLDGSELETLGWNFRNNYEVAVDSFGTLWQSDNDDDGNKAVRINYVMEFGNYGYVEEFSGKGWRDKRTNMEKEIPMQHWHLNDPGVVPNLLITGAGSPTGILVYEGDLLPKVFQNQVIHCDAGPNIVRSYPVTKDGAGYQGSMVNLVKGTDSWFRPADLSVAHDGSVLIADWNDPGVGGHNMGDRDPANIRGRIYRVAPKGHKVSAVKVDFTTPAGAAAALKSPNLATRAKAFSELSAMGQKAESELNKLWKSSEPRHRARAFHLLARIKGNEKKMVDQAVTDSTPEIRILGLRTARLLKLDIIPYVTKLADDSDAQVRRECAIALRHHTSADAPKLWAKLAQQHDGSDRWYLEALGIAMDRQEAKYFDAWLQAVGDKWNTPAGRDIIWRSRAAKAPALLVKIIADKNTAEADKQRYLRSLDFIKGPEKEAALIELLGMN